jgi:thiol-disulfide isomerase/thioredoxin
MQINRKNNKGEGGRAQEVEGWGRGYVKANASPRSALRRGSLFLAVLPLLLIGGCQQQETGSPSTNSSPINSATTYRPPSSSRALPPIDSSALSSTATLLEGGSARVEDLLGRDRVVLLNFWATWCAPCRREIPELVAIQREMRNKGVEVIGLTLEDPAIDRARVESFTRQFSINYRVGFLPEEMFRLFNVNDPRGPIPQTFIFDRQGRLIDHLKGFRRDFRQWAEGALQYALDHS